MVHETLANLSRLPAALVALIERFGHGALPETTATPSARAGAPAAAPAVQVGPCYGLLAGLHALAHELGIARAMGEATRPQRLRFTSFTPA